MKNTSNQLSFLDEQQQDNNAKITCLGIIFDNEAARRDHFRNELRKKLTELKLIDGFPIGEDEDIIALSDPPYYTACPNPWLNEFIQHFQSNPASEDNYYREPYTADISEGKRDPVYNAHMYHTKVPHKAIMRYILHYTEPSDIVMDGFSGTGMTGLAANLCGNPKQIEALGYRIGVNGEIYNKDNEYISHVGARNSILNDLSPMATFLSSNLNSPVDVLGFKHEAERIINEVQAELYWTFTTNHFCQQTNQNVESKVNYFVWSDVFICNNCTSELVFYDVATDKETGKVMKNFLCPNCKVELTKTKIERAKSTFYDEALQETFTHSKQKLVLVNYTYQNKKYNKIPDDKDLSLLDKIMTTPLNHWYPKVKLPEGYNTRQPLISHGLSHVHHFYTKRILLILSTLFNKLSKSKYSKQLKIWYTSQLINISKLNRYRPEVSFPYNPLNGTLYIGSQISEANVFDAYTNKLKRFVDAFVVKDYTSMISCSSSTKTSVYENSIDYIFTDPPFGANIMYSELSFIWESWLKVKTNNGKEAIINPVQQKTIVEYQGLIENSFKNYYKVLKPGRWITVEFSNSQAAVWNSIQEAMQRAGFVVANVSVLDKQQGSFKAVTSTTAVKQDLVISAYKPRQENIEKMKQELNTEESAWTFVSQHLEQLPVFIGVKGEAQIISERTTRILFDRMVAYHVQQGLQVPISSAEFQLGVSRRFPMRDGMAFLENQVAEYDKKRTLVKEFAQMSLFVSDETSAIEWIRQQLLKKPQTRQDLHPNYMKEIQHISKHELLPELDDLLVQNFLCYEGEGNTPDQILAYLRRTYKDLRGLNSNDSEVKTKAIYRWYVPDPNKLADLEKLREKALLREFDGYLAELEKNKKKLRQFRTEAIRAGFKKAYSEKDFQKIVKIGERLPESVILEDNKLLMYFDNACIRLGL